MRYDFSDLEDSLDLRCVPAGVHTCEVREVRSGTARDGSPRWSLKLDVAEGEHAGHHAAWDAITWSPRGVHRARLVLAALGFDVRGQVDVEPTDLVGRRAVVELQPETWEDPVTQQKREVLSVPFAGWSALGATDQAASVEQEVF